MPPMNGESSSNMYTLSCVKQIAGEKLLYNRETSLVLYDDLEGWDEQRGGRCKKEGIYIYIIIADLGYCMAETNNIVKQFSSN